MKYALFNERTNDYLKHLGCPVRDLFSKRALTILSCLQVLDVDVGIGQTLLMRFVRSNVGAFVFACAPHITFWADGYFLLAIAGIKTLMGGLGVGSLAHHCVH